MALFKILKGSGNLPTAKTEGWAYVKKINNEAAEFYVDYDANTRLQVGKQYNVVSATEDGIVPKFDAADGRIDSNSSDWVLTNNNGSLGWYRLPTNAFKNDNTNTTYTLSGAANGNTWVTTLTGSDSATTTSTVPAASTTAAGLMTPAMVEKLNGIAAGATANKGDITQVTAGDGLTGGATSGNATLSAKLGAGLVFDANKKIAANTSYTSANKNYAVKTDSSGALYVNVPWSDTDTHHVTRIYTGASGATANATSPVSNPYITVTDNNVYRTQVQLKGGGATSISADDGVITISSTNTTYSAFKGASASANGGAGLVPAPTKGQEGYYLRGDGVWFNLTGMDESVQNTFGALQKAWKEADSSLKNTLTTLINGKAQTNHASSGTSYGISTASLYGHAMASSTTPKASAATAAVGSETAKFARGDHVHPLTVANSWSGGVTAGPKLKTTINGVAGTAVAIPKATASVSGVVIVGDQTFGGIKRFSQADINATYHLGSFYNYGNGCLIDIGPAKSSTMVAIHITGNSYSSSDAPINSLYQVYDYGSGTTMNYSGISIGQDLGAMKVYRYNDRLYAHIVQKTSYSTLNITLYTNKAGLTPTVTNAVAQATGYTDLVTITPSRPPLADSGVTAGSYGPSANASPAHGGTFSVPYITFDAKGRATAASTKTITLPTYTIGNATITIKAGTGLKTGGSFTTNQTSARTITLDHSNSITAGSVGAAQSPSHGGTFAIPKITYDAQGHITEATTVNITLPRDNNTDTKVKQTVTTSNAAYPLLLAPNGQTTTTTTTSYFDSGVTLNPSTNTIAANISGNAATASALTSITETDKASNSDVWRRVWMGYSNNTTGRPAYDDRFAIQTSTGTLKAPIFSGALSGGVKDYNDNTLTKFGYSTSGMAQSAATWLGAWDATVSGEYRLRAVKQADLRVAYATSAGSATKDGSGNTITSKYVTVDTTQTISGAKTFSSIVKMTKGYTVHASSGTAGTVGHAKIATLKISGSYQNAPISFKFIRRNDKMPTVISIQFTNMDSADPTLTAFTGYGHNPAAAYLHKSATSTWDLYITKSEGYDTVNIIDFNNSHNGSVAVTWISNTQVASLPTGGTTCSWGGTIATAISADKTKAALTLNGKSFDGSTAVNMGVLSPTYGGTGKTTLIDASNALLNALTTGSSTPTDADYYISQYAGGGTTTTTYHRRPMSALWNYIQGKSDSRYVNVTGDTMTGQLTVPGFFYNSGDATLKFYASTNTTYGTESISIQTAFDAVDGQTHSYVTQYEDRCNLLLQPRGGQVYVGINHAAVGDTTNSLIVGGNAKITNLLTTGSGASHYGVKVGDTYINAINGELILQNNTAIRFGGDSWDYNVWAGLNYVHSTKTISLGLADNVTFTANSAQSEGTLALPGIRYFSVNGKRVLDAGDTWLRINEGNAFSAGVYFGTSLVRTDGQLQVGSGGSAFYAKSDGTGYFKSNLKVDGKLIMTGNIAYTNGGNQYDVIKFVTGDVNGAGLVLGGGGVVIIGSGESASNLQSRSGANIAGSTETTYITSDGNIEFYTNCQTISNRVGVILNASRHFYPNVNNTGSLGTTSYKWSTGYFYGPVNAGAVWAAHPTGGESDIGVSFASGKNLYLYANNSTGARGLYDSNKGSIISVTNSAASFNGNASTASVAAKLGRGGDTSLPMTFYWSGQSGQPTWLWGGSDGTNMYVYNPSNFNVNYANSAGSVAWANVTGKPSTFPPSSHTHNYAGSSSAGGAANSANVLNINATANLSNCLQYIQQSSQTSGNDLPSAAWWHVLKMNHGTGDTYFKRLLAFDFFSNKIKTANAQSNGTVNAWKQVWVEGDSVTGAVWNDYAEYRESDCQEFGRVLSEKGDDTLTMTVERLQPFAGISSDTWGFCQGETEKAKTPIAVAGRVLAYTYKDRNEYKPGDCVCAAPNGTVDIMTREEIIQYPDRIVGTVSCVPDYETWGSGDRDPVQVNGRIWIKVK